MHALFAIRGLVSLAGSDAWVLTPVKHLFGLIVVDVKRKKLLAKVKALAAVFDTLVILINLEKEQDVVFVDLAVDVVLLKETRDFQFDLLAFFFDLGRVLVVLARSLQRLVLVEVALKQAVVQVDVCKPPLVEVHPPLPERKHHMLQEGPQLVGMVHKYLQQLLDFHRYLPRLVARVVAARVFSDPLHQKHQFL